MAWQCPLLAMLGTGFSLALVRGTLRPTWAAPPQPWTQTGGPVPFWEKACSGGWGGGGEAHPHLTNEQIEAWKSEVALESTAIEWRTQTRLTVLFLLLQVELSCVNRAELSHAGKTTLLYLIKVKSDLTPPLPGLQKNAFFLALRNRGRDPLP